MIGSFATSKYTFDLHPEDVYFCTADCGWITGRFFFFANRSLVPPKKDGASHKTTEL